MLNKNKEENNDKIIIYNTEDGKTEIEVNLEGETVWLSQRQMSELFQTTVANINQHVGNVLKDGELEEFPTIKKSLIVQKE